MVESDRKLIRLVDLSPKQDGKLTLHFYRRPKQSRNSILSNGWLYWKILSFCLNKQRLKMTLLIIFSLHFALNSQSSFNLQMFGMLGCTVIIGIRQARWDLWSPSSALAAAAWTGSLTFPHSRMSEWWCHTSCSHRAGWLIQLNSLTLRSSLAPHKPF